MKPYELIVNQVLDKLDKGVLPWVKSWEGGMPCNYLNSKEYTGINKLVLLFDDFTDKRYLTVKQINKLGGKIKKGSKGTRILYWFFNEEEVIEENNKLTVIKKEPFIKYYIVFNIDQTTISKQIDTKSLPCGNNKYVSSIDIINSYKQKPKIVIGSSPYYSPVTDEIKIPEISKFKTYDDYYSVLFHELIHSTGIESRLGRYTIKNIKFGNDVYSREELVAELGSLFICSKVGLLKNTFDNSTAYLKGWLTYLKKNKNELLYASIEAEKAVTYILTN